MLGNVTGATSWPGALHHETRPCRLPLLPELGRGSGSRSPSGAPPATPLSMDPCLAASMTLFQAASAGGTSAGAATACAALVSTAFCATASSAAADENGELVRRGGARSAAADNHERERAVLALAHEDKVPTEHALRLRRVVSTRRDVEEAVELGLGHGALALEEEEENK